MRSPCYDEKNKMDCPERHAGCAVTCEKWAEYVRARNADYEKRHAEKDVDAVLAKSKRARMSFYQRRSIDDRQRRKNR